MKRILLGLVLLSNPIFAQVSVFSCDAYNDPTQAEILASNGQFYRGCVDLSDQGNYTLQQNFAQEIKANTNIHVTDVFHAGPYTGAANTHLVLGTTSPFDVLVMNYSILNNVLRYKKLELGIVLPEPYQTYVENFEAKENNPNLTFPENELINPFLEWEIDVEAHFKKVGASTETIVDGFFTNEINRNYSTNDWIATPSGYPIRVRFAPPENGNWECYVVVKIGETGTMVSTSAIFPFSVIESGNQGFVSVHENYKNLERGGEMIFPVGQNFAAPIFIEGTDIGIPSAPSEKAVPVSSWDRYTDLIESYINLGGKYIRTNQVVEGNLLEWEEKGNYYKRLHYAWEQDKLLELLEAHDVLMLFNLMNQEPIMMYGNYRMWKQDWDYWMLNPVDQSHYYEAGAGPINPYNDHPGEFDGKQPYEMFLNEDDLRYHEQRTRYYLARYGYSTSIYAFELLNEPGHLGQFSVDPGNPGETEPYYDVNHPLHAITKQAIANYHNVIGEYIKSHLHHTNQLVMCNAAKPAWHHDTGLAAHDQSIYSPYIDMIGLNMYTHTADKLLISNANLINENGQTKCVSDFWLATNKPVFMSECGSGDGTLECAEGTGEYIDVMTFGFTQVAGFNMWHALYGNMHSAYQANIRALYHMNAHTLNTLSNGSGQWVQRRQIEPHLNGDNEDLKENQYYVSSNGLNASGFVRNRAYNVGRESNPNVPYCSGLVNPDGSLFNTYRDISWADGTFNSLKVEGLMSNQNFVIEYYSYFQELGGGYLGYETQPSGSLGELVLHHPTLYTYDDIMPIAWYIVYLDPDQIVQNENVSQDLMSVVSTESLNTELFKNKELKIFPNPVNNKLFVHLNEIGLIILIDPNGKEVLHSTLSVGENSIDMSSLSEGLYTVKVLTSSNCYVQKVLKK